MKPHKVLWISLTSVFAVLAVGVGIASSLTAQYTSTINAFLHAATFKVEKTGDSDENTEYYASAWKSTDELVAHENALCEQAEGEGAVLLKNENGTLPLKTSSKFSCFSHSSVDPIFGGTGSGGVDASTAVTLRAGLKKSFGDESVNGTLWHFYSADCANYKRVNASTTGGVSADYKINEVPWTNISGNNDLVSTFASYGDVALVVLARSGGEGSDLPYNECSDGIEGDYLRLCQNEIDMLKGLKAYKDQGTFKKIVVLLNTSNALQLDFLDDADYGIDAALWIGGVGQTGMNAVGSLLSGAINPSGRLPDTLLKNNATSPAMVNFGMHAFSNKDEYGLDWENYNRSAEIGAKNNEKYHVYQEGIYIGYRYYETRYEDAVIGQGNTANYHYSDDVAYSFGYGASYTNWEYSNFKTSERGKQYIVTVDVKNAGAVAGKNTVQIYAQSPYTSYDQENGIEKSAVTLVGFAKSAMIEAGQSETLTLKIDKKDLASYDANKEKTYVMEGGDYYLATGFSAHDALNNILAKKGYDTSKGMTAEGTASLCQKITLSSTDTTSYSTSEETGYKITNQFDNADLNKYEGTSDQKITYVSRKDWTGTFPKQVIQLKVNQKMWEDGLINTTEGRDAIVKKMISEHYSDVKEMPTFGANNGLQLVSYRGVDYDSESWKNLIEQASYGEITNTMGTAFHVTAPVASVGLPGTSDENGPQGFTAKIVAGPSGMCYTSVDIMGATYNVDLMKDIGECIGEDFRRYSEGRATKYAGMYGPGGNIHRTPYCGRNFEYFSEDGILSAKMLEPECKGIQSKGVHVFVKHFFLNDEENGRMGLSTWCNEQAIRELYSRSFEGAIKGGGASSGVMTSFGRLGVVWAGAHYGAITNLLRNEWGCKGAVITDCSYSCPYMDYPLGVLAGVNLWDGDIGNGSLSQYASNPAVATMVQNSLKRICYSYANTLAMNGLSSNAKIVVITPWWKIAINAMIISFSVLATLSAGMLVYTIIKSKKAAEQVAA